MNPAKKHRMRLETEFNSTSSSASSSAAASRRMSLVSVPSMYQAFATAPRKATTPLAFTTEELQIAGNGTRVLSAITGKVKKVRHAQKSPRIGPLPTRTSDPKTIDKYQSKKMHPSVNNGGQFQAKPTVTTILRHHHVLERAEKMERDKVDSLLVLNLSHIEVDNLAREQLQKDEEQMRRTEAKKLLQAKLAYERAKAATQKVIDDKQKMAMDTRKEVKEWQVKLEQARKDEQERKKVMTEQLQKAVEGSRRAFDSMITSKQKLAAKLKKETEQLQKEAKLKQHEEELKRHDRIQQIQASKLALKQTRATKAPPKQASHNEEVPEMLRLQKEEEMMRLEETRKKIQRAKQIKSVKLSRAMKKIQNETVARKHSQENEINQSLPATDHHHHHHPSRDMLNVLNTNSKLTSTLDTSLKSGGKSSRKSTAEGRGGEIEKLWEELNQLKTENLRRRNWEQARRSCYTTSGSGTIQIIQPSDDVINPVMFSKSSSPLQNRSSIQTKFATLTVGRHF